MNGNTTRVNKSTSQQYWHVLTTLPAILKFDAKKSGYIDVFQAYYFRASRKSVDILQVKSIKAISGAYVHKDQTVSYFTTYGFGVAKLLFFRDCTTLLKYSIRYYLCEHERNFDEKTDLVPCNPKRLIPDGQGSQHARTRTQYNINH